MRHIRLFTPQPLNANANVTLDQDAAHHLLRVMRAKVGDSVTLFNGQGTDFAGQVVGITKSVATIRLDHGEPCGNRSPLRTHLGLCLSKGDRFDWAIQKATELGVDAITPLISERVDFKLPAERMAKKVGHWNGVVRSACEQCHRGYVPAICEPQRLADWLASVTADIKLVLYHHQPASLPESAPESAALLIGPEGGLSETEIQDAVSAGFIKLRLGPRVLRTETAPAVALTAIGLRWGDLG